MSVYLLRDFQHAALPESETGVMTYLLALTFLLLRLRRRTRFFLHLALIFADGSSYTCLSVQ